LSAIVDPPDLRSCLLSSGLHPSGSQRTDPDIARASRCPVRRATDHGGARRAQGHPAWGGTVVRRGARCRACGPQRTGCNRGREQAHGRRERIRHRL